VKTRVRVTILLSRLRRFGLRAVLAAIDEFRGFRIRLAVLRWLLWLPPHSSGSRFRRSVLKLAGVSIGHGTVVLGPITIGGAGRLENLVIGDDCTINGGSFLDPADRLTIGNDVAIGHDVLIMTSSHELGTSHRRHGPVTSAPVTIGDGAWLCSRSVIQPGIDVGRGAVVLAGAVVTRSVPPNVVVGGVPAGIVTRPTLDQVV
jgi:maltose O-acetyltransferase